MKTVAAIVGALALIILPTVRSGTLFDLRKSISIEANLADDLPVRMPLRTDFSRIQRKRDIFISCFDCYTGFFADLLWINLLDDSAISLSEIFD
ncbi:MAG: hypothetical protein WAO00_18780 [Chthoniobacterales bacterium]